RPGRRDRRPGSGPSPPSGRVSAAPPSPLHRPYPLGPHSGFPVLWPGLPPQHRAEHLRPRGLSSPLGGRHCRADAVLLLPCETARPPEPHPFHGIGRSLLPHLGGARACPPPA